MDHILHGGFGTLNEAVINTDNKRFVYLFRKIEEGISIMNFDTYEEAEIEMPSYFLIGACTGNFLNSLKHLINEQFKKMMTDSFGEPFAKKTPSIKSSKDAISVKSESTAYKTPSDYRKMSLTPSKSKIGPSAQTQASAASAPEPVEHEKNAALTETPIRDDLKTEILGLERALNWTIEHIDDEIDLPLTQFPEELQTDLPEDELIKNKELIEKLQDIVMAWERHILKVIEIYLAKVKLIFTKSEKLINFL